MITIYDGPKESNNAQITIKNRIPHGKISEFLGQLKKHTFLYESYKKQQKDNTLIGWTKVNFTKRKVSGKP